MAERRKKANFEAPRQNLQVSKWKVPSTIARQTSIDRRDQLVILTRHLGAHSGFIHARYKVFAHGTVCANAGIAI
jgi:hypothetical protein